MAAVIKHNLTYNILCYAKKLCFALFGAIKLRQTSDLSIMQKMRKRLYPYFNRLRTPSMPVEYAV
jgi:hypothetical protein